MLVNVGFSLCEATCLESLTPQFQIHYPYDQRVIPDQPKVSLSLGSGVVGWKTPYMCALFHVPNAFCSSLQNFNYLEHADMYYSSESLLMGVSDDGTIKARELP